MNQTQVKWANNGAVGVMQKKAKGWWGGGGSFSICKKVSIVFQQPHPLPSIVITQ